MFHFMPLVSLCTPWDHQEISGFLMFSGGIEIDQWHVMSWVKIYGKHILVSRLKLNLRKTSKISNLDCVHFFSIWVSFHEHLQFTAQQVKREAISLTPVYHLLPLNRHLDISRAIIAEGSPWRTVSSRTCSGNF